MDLVYLTGEFSAKFKLPITDRRLLELNILFLFL